MIRRVLTAVPGVLAAILLASVALAAPGDHISAADFNLTISVPQGITWTGTEFLVVNDTSAQTFYYYSHTSTGTYSSQSVYFRDGSVFDAGPSGIAWRDGVAYVVSNASDRFFREASSGGNSVPLTSSNTAPNGITWDGAYFRVVDSGNDKVYSYTSARTYTSSADFNLMSDNGNPTGITWDGSYYRVVDNGDDKVYTYTSTGTYVSSEDFNLASDNTAATGITWDGTYYRVVDSGDDKVYTYEGPTSTTPQSNFGLSEDNRDYAAAISTSVSVYGDWKCLRSTAGETVRVNNARLTVHGFCAKPDSGGNGMDLEIHLPSSSGYADLSRFINVTGHWWFIEEGIPAQFNQRVYDDMLTTEEDTADDIPVGALAWSEQIGGLESSDRLGFDTLAKTVSDDDCDEEEDDDESDDNLTDGRGFSCSRAFLTNMSAGDTAVLLFSLTDENRFEFAGTPTLPESLAATRNDDYTTTTLSWELYDAVSLYEIQRTTAVLVDVADASRIEYGNPVTFTVTGTEAGIDEYEDTTVEAHRTYQYRIRARGADSTSWSSWTEYTFSGAKPEVDLQAPANLALTRDTASIIASWAAPAGDLDNYTLQRQELVVAQGTTFFGNVVTLGDGVWLPGNSTMYTDSSILPNQIYEYRVAAVLDDQVCTYSDWFRIGPQITDLGAAPGNFRLLESGNRILDGRREFWMAWDAVPGAEDYEVQVLTFDYMTGGQSSETRIVTDPTYFQTSFERVALRVRGRRLDADSCSTNPDNYCLSNWTRWYSVNFAPAVTIPSPDLPDDTADESIAELKDSLVEVLEASLEPTGADINPHLVLEFMVLVAAFVAAILSIALSWKRGMAPLGVGMGVAIAILILFTGYRLLDTSVAWPIAAQFMIAVLGLIALVRQTGVFR